MSGYLVIVESPAKAKTIGRFLGKKYKVEASAGHLRDLPVSKLAIDIENDFKPQYMNIRGKGESKHSKRMQRMRIKFFLQPTRIGKEKRFLGICRKYLILMRMRFAVSLLMK